MKKKIVILSLFILTAVFNAKAQGLQPGECGIRFTYDAAGNLIQREFICNNTGVVMNKVLVGETSKTDSVNTIPFARIKQMKYVPLNPVKIQNLLL